MCRPEKRSPSLDLEDVERSSLMASEQNKSDMNLSDCPSAKKAEAGGGGAISKMGLRVLLLLAVQNCAKNLVMRAAVGGGAKFLYSAAVIGTEGTKCACSVAFVLCMFAVFIIVSREKAGKPMFKNLEAPVVTAPWFSMMRVWFGAAPSPAAMAAFSAGSSLSPCHLCVPVRSKNAAASCVKQRRPPARHDTPIAARLCVWTTAITSGRAS